jgi:mycothiol maleylpyruvate isomerase-like protein
VTAGPRTAELLAELERERRAFLDALDALPNPEGRRIVESWDGRDLTVHVAFWSDHGANAVRLASAGRGADFDYDQSRTDEMNAEVTARGHGLPLATALEREAAAYERLRAGLAELDEALLDLQLGNGDTVEEVVRYDGPDHYAEHTAQLRAVPR